MADSQDVFAQQETLRRRRALLDAMTQQNMQSPIVGNTGLGQALTKVATAYMLKGKQSKTDSDMAEGRDQYNGQLSGELDKYLAQRNGSPGGEVAGDGMGPPTEAGAGANPRAAILAAMTSKFPEMQGIGKAEFSQLGKQDDYKEHVLPDGTLVRTTRKGVENMGNYAKPADKYSDPYTIKTDDGKNLTVRRNLSTNKVEPIDTGVKVTNTTNVDTTGNKEALKATADVLKDARGDQIAAAKARYGAEQIMKLAQDPQVVTGFGASPVLGIQALSTKLGFTGPESAAKTQELVTAMAKETLDASIKLKGSISDKDREFLQQAGAGSIAYTPEAIQHIAGLAMAAAHNSMLDSRQQWESAATVKGADEIVKLHPQPSFGSWNMDPKMFGETVNGRVQYLGGAASNMPVQPGVEVPQSGTSTEAATPRGTKLDGRIKWSDMKGNR